MTRIEISFGTSFRPLCSGNKMAAICVLVVGVWAGKEGREQLSCRLFCSAAVDIRPRVEVEALCVEVAVSYLEEEETSVLLRCSFGRRREVIEFLIWLSGNGHFLFFFFLFFCF